MVVATVVAPVRFWLKAKGRSRRDNFNISVLGLVIWASSAAFSPAVATPSRTAMVAGTAPLSRMVCSSNCAVLHFQDEVAHVR